ncbi:unnamed protein product [Rhizophagus irregularis]|nr:unnamed protein product [Rhizophagus irregularis]CAB4425812.1 unnamed protein product [Rhizophagus irregularis]
MDTNNSAFKKPPKLQPPLQQLQHYNSLNNQLTRLQQNMSKLEENIKLTLMALFLWLQIVPCVIILRDFHKSHC